MEGLQSSSLSERTVSRLKKRKKKKKKRKRKRGREKEKGQKEKGCISYRVFNRVLKYDSKQERNLEKKHFVFSDGD